MKSPKEYGTAEVDQKRSEDRFWRASRGQNLPQ
jgi:hypothetical protein